MEEITRYAEGSSRLEKRDNGTWCLYSDHRNIKTALEQELKKLKEKLSNFEIRSALNRHNQNVRETREK